MTTRTRKVQIGALALAFTALQVSPPAIAAYNFPTVISQFTGDMTTSGQNSYTTTVNSFNGGTLLKSMAGQAANAVAVSGGSIDGTTIGATTPSSARVTTLTSTGAATLASVSTASLAATGGSVDGATLGATTPSSARVTTLSTSGLSTQTGGRVVGVLTATAAATLVAANEQVCLNGTAAFTLTLDAAPVEGEQHDISDCGFTAGTNNVTIVPSNAAKINNTTSLVFTVNGQAAHLTYRSAFGWVVS